RGWRLRMRVLVTGGTSGLGLAVASALAGSGAMVGLTGRSGARAMAAAAGGPGAVGPGVGVGGRAARGGWVAAAGARGWESGVVAAWRHRHVGEQRRHRHAYRQSSLHDARAGLLGGADRRLPRGGRDEPDRVLPRSPRGDAANAGGRRWPHR